MPGLHPRRSAKVSRVTLVSSNRSNGDDAPVAYVVEGPHALARHSHLYWFIRAARNQASLLAFEQPANTLSWNHQLRYLSVARNTFSHRNAIVSRSRRNNLHGCDLLPLF